MNLLDKFKDTSIGSSGRIIDFSSKIASSGDFTKLYDLDAIISSWINILTTMKGSMDHDPEFGSDLYLYLFEPTDDDTAIWIKNEIRECLSKYDSRASISEINVTYLRKLKGFNVSIIVNYEGEVSKFDVSFNEQRFQSQF